MKELSAITRKTLPERALKEQGRPSGFVRSYVNDDEKDLYGESDACFYGNRLDPLHVWAVNV